MDQNEAISRLIEGNNRFVKDQMNHVPINQAKRSELASGQSPYAIILSCADSRVVPEIAFNTGLGELFVVRVAGNVANKSSLASMEYAVANLGTQLIVVLGHQSCGAVTAAVQGGDNGPNLNHLLAHISPAFKAASDPSLVDEVIRKNAEITAKSIYSNSAIISKAVESGKVKIVPAYYHLDTGRVEFLI